MLFVGTGDNTWSCPRGASTQLRIAALPVPVERIERAWADVLGRLPTDREREESLKFLEEYRDGLAELKVDRAEMGPSRREFERSLVATNSFIWIEASR